MKRLLRPFVVASVFVFIASATLHAKELAQLKVLYVGSERTAAFVNFMTDKVAQFEAKSRDAFRPADAASFDVVMFDWPQSQETRDMRTITSPLGDRESWTKPTVLLGSAGLNLAVSWKLRGGSGCTCLDPLAYDLREHEIFERPNKLDRGQAIDIPTPPDFQHEIKEPTIKVLALVDDRDKRFHPGWCTYTTNFASNPDVEFFCGGVNQKTPTAAALWRQGNLLHFGFDQSPAEMNDTGRAMLLNAVAYISRFTEDRPIAVTPSVFAGPVARFRETPARWLRNPEYPPDFGKDLVTPQIWETMQAISDREGRAKWADKQSRFFHPNRDQKLEIDDDLAALDVAFDVPEFFDKVLAGLRSGDATAAARARRLLERYVPIGPQNGNADEWAAWWQENRPYAFASDAGDYRWYIDPLAKSRGVPSTELRGPKRADPPQLKVSKN